MHDPRTIILHGDRPVIARAAQSHSSEAQLEETGRTFKALLQDLNKQLTAAKDDSLRHQQVRV